MSALTAPNTAALSDEELLALAWAQSEGVYRPNCPQQLRTAHDLKDAGYLTDRTRPGNPYEFKITPAGADLVARETAEARTNGR
ncbi:hypothetical protein GCM10007989_07700 [Devosia pacifica]|uniref:Uncharacterized protein n=1 Tax=Devosia pacifica TaxID=1335967 RepID=A0A918RWN6_9HYPH|nr:hypothetical protein [Devosia pacifica]GHA15389.1 hypothetical protein GCM10007989_07700 [Devosia pacifica]